MMCRRVGRTATTVDSFREVWGMFGSSLDPFGGFPVGKAGSDPRVHVHGLVLANSRGWCGAERCDLRKGLTELWLRLRHADGAAAKLAQRVGDWA